MCVSLSPGCWRPRGPSTPRAIALPRAGGCLFIAFCLILAHSTNWGWDKISIRRYNVALLRAILESIHWYQISILYLYNTVREQYRRNKDTTGSLLIHILKACLLNQSMAPFKSVCACGYWDIITASCSFNTIIIFFI